MVDIVSYLAVYHLFVAHMTGDTVHLGHYLVLGNLAQASRAGTVIGSFVLGSIAGRSIIEVGLRRKMRSVATIALLIEAGLILAPVWGTPGAASQAQSIGTVYWMLAVLAAAMGMQTATLTRIGPLTIHTTFVTGMLNKLSQEVSRWLFWVHDEFRRRASWSDLLHGSKQHNSARNAAFMLGIWCCYLLGSLLGTWMSLRWSARSLYIPVALLGMAAVIDQVWPLSLEEEKDQA